MAFLGLQQPLLAGLGPGPGPFAGSTFNPSLQPATLQPHSLQPQSIQPLPLPQPQVSVAGDGSAVPPPPDGVAQLRFSPFAAAPGSAGALLAGCCWDGGVRAWAVSADYLANSSSSSSSTQSGYVGGGGGGGLSARAEAAHLVAEHYLPPQQQQQPGHSASAVVAPLPVLAVDWADAESVFACDSRVFLVPLGQTQAEPLFIGTHDQAVKDCRFLPESGCLLTASWDRTLRAWDARAPGVAIDNVSLPERAYAMDARGVICVVATAGREIAVYDLRKNLASAELRRFPSPLKFQTRSLALFPDASGFAVGSIEGRVAIHHVADADQHKNFKFRCDHAAKETWELTHAVNALSFHPFGVLATATSDGRFAFWDKDRQKLATAFEKGPVSISAAQFDSTGNLFAYASSYDWSNGLDEYQAASGNMIYIRAVSQDDITARGGASGGSRGQQSRAGRNQSRGQQRGGGGGAAGGGRGSYPQQQAYGSYSQPQPYGGYNQSYGNQYNANSAGAGRGAGSGGGGGGYQGRGSRSGRRR